MHLYRNSQNCRNCGIKTYLSTAVFVLSGHPGANDMRLVPGKLRDIMATLEHRRSRLNPDRGRGQDVGRVNRNDESITTLFCYKCNYESGRAEYLSIPKHVRDSLSSAGHTARKGFSHMGDELLKLKKQILEGQTNA